MLEVVVFNLPLQMVPRMHHLMRHGILLVSPIPKLVRTQQYPVIEVEPPALLVCTQSAVYVVLVQVPAQLPHLVGQEADYRTVLQKVVARRFAPLAVPVAVYGVLFCEVLLLEGGIARPVHAREEDCEGVGPVVVYGVDLCGGVGGCGGCCAIGRPLVFGHCDPGPVVGGQLRSGLGGV